MATIHFEKTPYQRDLFGVPEEEVEGKFRGWQKNANYDIALTVILQIDTTNVTDAEYSIAPNITFLSTNQAIINIYKTHNFTGSFKEFQTWYAGINQTLELYVKDLVTRLNNARAQTGHSGSWYVNYGLDDRHITVNKVSE